MGSIGFRENVKISMNVSYQKAALHCKWWMQSGQFSEAFPVSGLSCSVSQNSVQELPWIVRGTESAQSRADRNFIRRG